MPLIWVKENPQPSHTLKSFRSAYEMGLWLVNDGASFAQPKTFNFLTQARMRNVMSYLIGRDGYKRTQHPTEKPELLTRRLIEIFTNDGDTATQHPTEKPELLTRRLVEIFTNEGDIVLDNFAGGGTTGVAAFKAGRHAISIEREAKYIAMIERRQQAVERRLMEQRNDERP